MPTATTTTTTSRKFKTTLVAPNSATATLNTLYHRAARAFVLRQVPLVHSLLESAFALLPPPETVYEPDDLAPARSKWDLLRIALETTIHASPPADDLPGPLRELLAQPAHALITSAYRRSLSLFTPCGVPQKAAHIPSAIILTLVYSSLKLDAPDAGRIIVEDWLATRNYSVLPANAVEEEGNYRKVVETYCLCVLPKLEQWEYAKEFLEYESELSPDSRESMKNSLQSLHAQAVAARLPTTPRTLVSSSSSSSLSTLRPYSPTPSTSSSSSLSSTASMHTVVPATPRPQSQLNSEVTRGTSSSASTPTATPRARSSALPIASPPRTQHTIPRVFDRPLRAAAAPPSTFALLKASLSPYITSHAKLSAISLATFVLLLVLPLFIRRRRAATTHKGFGGVAGGNAELVRRRLLAASAANGGGPGLFGRMFAAAVRTVGDTIRMGGSGLV